MQMASKSDIVAECLEVRARLRVRRWMLGGALERLGACGGRVEMVGVESGAE